MDSTMEHWKSISGYEGLYEVSTTGCVRSIRRGIVLRPWKKPKNYAVYLQIHLWKNGTRRSFEVHKVVITTFRGPRLPEQQCRHIDGNSFNNQLDNLVWGTATENSADRIRHGRAPSKLTVAQVRSIRESCESTRALARVLGVGKSTVAYARSGHNWKHVT